MRWLPRSWFMIGGLAVFLASYHVALAYIRAPRDVVNRAQGAQKEPGGVAFGNLTTCPACHDLVTKAVRASAHGRAGLDCAVCHSFATARHADPDAFLRDRFYAMVTMSVCARCHGATVRQWREGRHVNPVDVFIDRINPALPRELEFHNRVTLKVKMANPCLLCHEPHSYKPGIDWWGGAGRSDRGK